MTRKLLVADLLCGAGGSSTGCKHALDALGLEMELVCVNHWPTAIETHRRNHPEARHYVQDIATVRPHLLVPEGYLDLLMASPTCTHHSVARGGKPTSDQQRSDPWHIITWLTELRVKRIIIENVWEFTGWGPVDPNTGKPIKARKGEYFNAWIETLRRLGFEPAWRKLNAADYGDATTRQRFILMARSDGRRIFWPSPTHQRREAASGDLFAEKPWRPAREIIDWSIKGKSIFTRPKPLAPKTLARIYAGAVKFDWPQPFLVILRNHMAAQGMDDPLPTIAAGGSHIGIAEPILIKQNFRRDIQGTGQPAPTIMTEARIGLAEPVIMNGRKGNQPKGVSTEPVPTLDTKGGVWLAEPLVLSQHSSGTPRTTRQPLPTIMTGGAGVEHRPGCARPMLVEPFILNRHGDGYGETRAHSVDDPAPTSNCDGGGYLVEPFVLSRQGEGAPRSVDDPTPSQTTVHSHVLISPYYSNGWQEESGAAPPCFTADDPVPPITTKGRFGMVVPITHADGGNRARDVEVDGLPTITGANRGELAFITAQHGEREGQAPRVHSVDHPTPTIAATGHVDLIEATAEYDILFRMLEPHELSAAMGLEDYDFAGTKTEKIKQIGNAVSRRKMQACVTAIVADEAPKGREAAPIDYQEAAE